MADDSHPTSRPAPHRSASPRPDRRSAVGARGEDLAVEHLTELGYAILARNWRLAAGSVRGELDIVCRAPSGAVVFVEVKTRRAGGGYGGALGAVTFAKQRKIRQLALAFLREAGMRVRSLRFDVIAVEYADGAANLTHVERAF